MNRKVNTFVTVIGGVIVCLGVFLLKNSLPGKLLIAGLAFVIWDQLAALRKYRDFKLFTTLRRKEHDV